MAEVGTLNIQVNTREVKQASVDLATLEKSGAGAEKSVQGLSNVAAKLAATLAGLGIANFVKESSLLAARHETLGVVMLQAGKNAGYGSDQMRKFEKDLRAQGIAAIEARQSLTKMSAAQMDLAQAGQIARAAQDLAVVGGINSSEALMRMTQGIQSAEAEVLRTIGLNVSWEDSYKRVAKELGRNANSLTTQEKLQARVNEVLLKAKEYNGVYEESMKTAGKQISSFTRYWQDMQVDLGNSELPAVTVLVQQATQRIKEFTAYIQKEDTQRALSAIGNTAVLTFDTLSKLAQQVGPLFMSVLDGYNRLPDIIKEVGLVGVLLGGKQGKLILASLALFSSVTSSLAKIRDAKQAYGSEGVAYFSRDELNKQAEYARSMEGIQLRLANVRREMATIDSGAGGVSFYKRDNEARRQALKDEEARLIGELTQSSGLASLQAKENDIRAAQARIYGGAAAVHPRTPDKPGGDDKTAEKLRKAMEKANEARLEAVADIRKLNTETERETQAMNDEIAVLGLLGGVYGETRAEALAMYQAGAKASKEYSDQVEKGVTVENAAANMAAKMAKAQNDLNEARRRSAEGVAAGFSGPAYNAAVDTVKAQYSLILSESMADDRLAVERELNSKLSQMESARLRKTDSFYNGAKSALLDYADSVGTAASRMGDLWAKGFKGAEDALSNMIGKGKLDLASFFDMMRVEAARSMVVQPMLGGFASMLKGQSWLSSFFPSANGNAFGPGGVYAFATGGIVSSPTAFRFGAGGANLGIMGEAGPEAIMPLKRGSDGKLGVAAPSGGPQNVTVKLVNQSGQQIKASTSKVTQDSQGTLVTVILDAVNRNVGGIRTGLQAALGN